MKIDDKSTFFINKINQFLRIPQKNIEKENTLIKNKNEGCLASFHSCPNSDFKVVSFFTSPKFGLKWFPRSELKEPPLLLLFFKYCNEFNYTVDVVKTWKYGGTHILNNSEAHRLKLCVYNAYWLGVNNGVWQAVESKLCLT